MLSDRNHVVAEMERQYPTLGETTIGRSRTMGPDPAGVTTIYRTPTVAPNEGLTTTQRTPIMASIPVDLSGVTTIYRTPTVAPNEGMTTTQRTPTMTTIPVDLSTNHRQESIPLPGLRKTPQCPYSRMVGEVRG